MLAYNTDYLTINIRDQELYHLHFMEGFMFKSSEISCAEYWVIQHYIQGFMFYTKKSHFPVWQIHTADYPSEWDYVPYTGLSQIYPVYQMIPPHNRLSKNSRS